MKKLLFLLLLSVSSYGQTLQNPTFGTVTIKNSATVTTTPALTTTETTGLQKKIDPINLPISTATQTALNTKISGSASSGQVSFWNGTRTQIGDNSLFWDNTNKRLGIGTATPTVKLEVKETTTSTSAVINNTNGFDSQLTINSNSTTSTQLVLAKTVTGVESPRWVFRADATGESGSNVGSDFRLISRTDAGAQLADAVFIKRSTGNVLINSTTDNGADKLQVAGTISASAATTANHVVIKSQLDLKANIASPAFTGTPTAPTATAGNSTTALATTAFVTTADNLKANIASPAFTGVPTAPTATEGTNTTQVATTAFVQIAITNNGTITTATNITNATLTDTSLPQNGKTLLISNSASNINYTVNGSITASFVKGGTGAITFVQGSGRTMVAANGTLVFNGARYSTASIVSFGTTDIVYINNF